MSAALNSQEQRALQTLLYDFDELARAFRGKGLSLVLTTHPLPASDRFTATVTAPTGAEVFTWSRP